MVSAGRAWLAQSMLEGKNGVVIRSSFYCAQPPVAQATARSLVGNVPLTDGAPSRWPFYLYCRQHRLWPQEVMGLDPNRDPRAFDPYCPVHNITPDFPPTLLLHSTADTDVPYEQSAQMAAALASAGAHHPLATVGHQLQVPIGLRARDLELIA